MSARALFQGQMLQVHHRRQDKERVETTPVMAHPPVAASKVLMAAVHPVDSAHLIAVVQRVRSVRLVVAVEAAGAVVRIGK